MLCLMLITGDPRIAVHAVASGVGRIFIDMEVLGKAERQGHLDTHKAAHTVRELRSVRRALSTGDVMVRVNPLHDGTAQQTDAVIEAGADRIMLPMFRTAADARSFLEIVARRVPVTLLVETPSALCALPEYVELLQPGDEVHFGLNDLSIGMGLSFLFEPLAGRLLDGPAALLRRAGVPFGIGGIGRIGGAGRAPAELVLSEHVRLGSRAVILSRAFMSGAQPLADDETQADFANAVAELRAAEARLRGASAEELEDNARRLAAHVLAIKDERR